MTVSALNAYILVDIEDYSSLKIMVLLGVVTLGLILSIASNRLIASWEQIIKLYLLLDSVVPVIIAAIIACYTILKFASTGQWE